MHKQLVVLSIQIDYQLLVNLIYEQILKEEENFIIKHFKFEYQQLETTFASTDNMDAYGYIYQGNFYPSYPQYTIITEDDESGENNQFKMAAPLRSDITYILVVTTYEPDTIGSYGVTVAGPNSITITPILI